MKENQLKIRTALLAGLLLMLVNPLLAQTKGVHFEQGLTWEQIVEKAKKKHRVIFVDCYATWCGPCKQMDRKVYPDSLLGVFMNSDFVSVKLQMDSTAKDNEDVKALYATAKEFQRTYQIGSLPTYLFFYDGKLVHRNEGFQPVLEFLQIA